MNRDEALTAAARALLIKLSERSINTDDAQGEVRELADAMNALPPTPASAGCEERAAKDVASLDVAELDRLYNLVDWQVAIRQHPLGPIADQIVMAYPSLRARIVGLEAALETIRSMSEPKLGFPFTGKGTKLRMGPTVIAKATEINVLAAAALSRPAETKEQRK